MDGIGKVLSGIKTEQLPRTQSTQSTQRINKYSSVYSVYSVLSVVNALLFCFAVAGMARSYIDLACAGMTKLY